MDRDGVRWEWMDRKGRKVNKGENQYMNWHGMKCMGRREQAGEA